MSLMNKQPLKIFLLTFELLPILKELFALILEISGQNVLSIKM